jgi:hypothetical protein
MRSSNPSLQDVCNLPPHIIEKSTATHPSSFFAPMICALLNIKKTQTFFVYATIVEVNARRRDGAIAGIELLHRIRKGQFDLGCLGVQDQAASTIWTEVLSA